MNSVELIAVCKEVVREKYRRLEYSLPCFNDENKNSQQILALYWTTGPNSRLLTLPIGSHIALRGHLDACEKFGTIIIVEQFELLR